MGTCGHKAVGVSGPTKALTLGRGSPPTLYTLGVLAMLDSGGGGQRAADIVI